ncbi:MAG: cupin [Gammaproteobacteria bacterium]|nr:cupin [Gammaproteobacteria bacterium]NKB64913.1 cupin [Gammaproteobacteria bacterium]
MRINADFDERIVVHSAEMEWINSPMAGVSRRPLDRVGTEVARATSIVRYAPGSHFSPHVHTGGEEFLVLDGVFQDEHSDFPTGSYVRNPPNSSHTPGSQDGCIIFVKLWQFDMEDRTHVNINTNQIQPALHHEMKGVSVIPLYHDQFEEVDIQIWDPDSEIYISNSLGMEILVLDGSFHQGGETLQTGSWLRLPCGSNLLAQVGEQGARIWAKHNHLGQVDAQIERVLNHC